MVELSSTSIAQSKQLALCPIDGIANGRWSGHEPILNSKPRKGMPFHMQYPTPHVTWTTTLLGCRYPISLTVDLQFTNQRKPRCAQNGMVNEIMEHKIQHTKVWNNTAVAPSAFCLFFSFLNSALPERYWFGS